MSDYNSVGTWIIRLNRSSVHTRGPDMDTGVPVPRSVGMGTRLEAGLPLCWWGWGKRDLDRMPYQKPTKNRWVFFRKIVVFEELQRIIYTLYIYIIHNIPDL